MKVRIASRTTRLCSPVMLSPTNPVFVSVDSLFGLFYESLTALSFYIDAEGKFGIRIESALVVRRVTVSNHLRRFLG